MPLMSMKLSFSLHLFYNCWLKRYISLLITFFNRLLGKLLYFYYRLLGWNMSNHLNLPSKGSRLHLAISLSSLFCNLVLIRHNTIGAVVSWHHWSQHLNTDILLINPWISHRSWHCWAKLSRWLNLMGKLRVWWGIFETHFHGLFELTQLWGHPHFHRRAV
jgi:hypothetical protein